jgi:signal transduction histidine kinase
MTKQFVSGVQDQVSINIKYWTNLIGEKSSPYVLSDARDDLKKHLTLPAEIPFVNYVHVYRLNTDSAKLELFYSYKRSERRSAIPEKSSDISNLLVPKFIQNYVEYMHPIKHNNEVIGFVYMQSNAEYIAPVTNQILTSGVLITFTFLLITVFIVLRLERYITTPIITLTNTIQAIARQKDYSMRCKAMSYRETDILAHNINILLARINKHVEQLGMAEQQSIEHSHELENKVSKRTQALKESNQELLSTLEKLHQFQDQLVESEKMASLGDMVAGVAHEVNTPIGLGVTASTLLSDRLNEIKAAFEDKTLKSSQLKKFLLESTENVAIIYRNLNRAAALISSFKKVAVDQSSDDIREFNVKELLTEVLLTLRPQLSNLPYTIEIDCPTDLIISSKPGPINQILINLIMNSVIHGFEGRDHGVITIIIMSLSNQLNIIFKDDGIGVDKSIEKKVFEPFTTTKRGEGGSGLGLHLVYNLVTQALYGTISLDSESNEGVKFEINFPIK